MVWILISIFSLLLLLIFIIFLKGKEKTLQTAKVKVVEKLDDYLYNAKLRLRNGEVEALLFSKFSLKPNTTVVVERKDKKIFEVKKIIGA